MGGHPMDAYVDQIEQIKPRLAIIRNLLDPADDHEGTSIGFATAPIAGKGEERLRSCIVMPAFDVED